jgi:hypothetical protein
MCENYIKKESYIPIYDDLDKNIKASWNFIKMTHDIHSNEVCCIRGLATKTNEFDKYCFNKEFVIWSFNNEDFEKYKKFISGLINSKRTYNIFYNTFKISPAKVREWNEEHEKNGFFGKGCNVTATNMVVLDFDGMDFDQYQDLKQFLLDRGLKGTIDIMSGHGYHIVFRIEDCSDKLILFKFIKIFQELGFNSDITCQDPGRVFRLPYFYNIKPKYEFATLCEIVNKDEDSKVYKVEEIFEKLGYDYNTFNLDKYYEDKKKERTKKEKQPKQKTKNETQVVNFDMDFDLDDIYTELNFDEIPLGIQNMLKGFVEGYSNIQVYCLTMFFKQKGLDLDDIISIIKKCENINNNDWNNWDTEQEIIRFYNNYNYLNKYIYKELETIFGSFSFNIEDTYIIPVGYDAKDTQLYIYLLCHGNQRKKDILEGLHISNNKLDRIMETSKLCLVNNHVYSISNHEFGKYIRVNCELLHILSTLNHNQLACYVYIRFRCGISRNIQTSIESFKNVIGLSEKTITNSLKELEELNLINIKRFKPIIKDGEFCEKESNIYSLKEKKEHGNKEN